VTIPAHCGHLGASRHAAIAARIADIRYSAAIVVSANSQFVRDKGDLSSNSVNDRFLVLFRYGEKQAAPLYDFWPNTYTVAPLRDLLPLLGNVRVAE
jgi:hypothetical protein